MRSSAILSPVVSLIGLPFRLSVSTSRPFFRSCGGVGGGEELRAQDLVVQFAVFKQFIVRAARRYTALVEDQDQVGVPHRRNSLRDDEDRAVLLAHEPVQRLLDRRLRLGVHGGGAVVEDEQTRVYE